MKIPESIQSIIGLYSALINVANTLYRVPVPTASQLHFAFTPEGTQHTFSRHRAPQQLCHRIQPVQKDLHHVHQEHRCAVTGDIILQGDSFDTLLADT